MATHQHLKKIVFASPVSDFVGGAERSMFELVINTKEHGYTPIVIVPRKGKIETSLREAGIKTYRVNFDWWARGTNGRQPSFNKYRIANGEAVLQMAQILEKEKPLACVSYTAVFPWLAYAASICSVPHIWQVCEMLDDENHWSLRLPTQKLLGIVDILSIKIFANSEVCKEHLTRFITNRTKEIEVIYPYVDQGRALAMSQETPPILPTNKYRMCLVGNIQPAKGQLEAVQALAELRERGYDISLLLVGKVMNDRYLDSLQKFISSKKLKDHVRLTAHVDNPHVYVKNCDVALVCSPHEAFGRTTIEAMAVGTPIVGVSSDGTKEIIREDGEYGLLYAAGDSQKLAQQIERLLTNEGLRQRISQRAQEYVTAKFTRENNQKPFFNYLTQLAHDDSKLHPPFTDILLAYRKYVLLEREKIAELRAENDVLSNEITEIRSSKKWQMLEKIAAAQKKLR